MTKQVPLLTLMLFVAACRDAQPALPTRDEAAQLDEAEAMLNQSAKEEGPEAGASDPSS